MFVSVGCFCFQAEDGIRGLVRSRGLGDVYKRQQLVLHHARAGEPRQPLDRGPVTTAERERKARSTACLLYTSDAADERSSVDLGGRRIIKKKKQRLQRMYQRNENQNKK